MLIKNGKIFLDGKGFIHGEIRIENNRIAAVGEDIGIGPEEAINAGGNYILPGFIDIHTHGALGNDTMEATYAALEGMSIFYASKGVTSFLPTTMTAPIMKIVKALENIRDTMERGTSGAKILGANLEGPFVSIAYKGAQPEEYIVRPTRELVQSLLERSGMNIKIIVLAPELDSMKEIIHQCVSQNITVGIGHTAANYLEAKAAFQAGATHITHLFNSMAGIHHREPGLVGAALEEDQTSVEIIADGIHLHPAMIRLVSKCKPADKMVLVTDSTMAAGLEDGQYSLGNCRIFVKNRAARLENGALAGSTLTMSEAVRNMVQLFHIPMEEAVRMATLAPAKVLGIEQVKGSIAPGKDADLIFVDPDFQVKLTMVEGKIVYRACTDGLERVD